MAINGIGEDENLLGFYDRAVRIGWDDNYAGEDNVD